MSRHHDAGRRHEALGPKGQELVARHMERAAAVARQYRGRGLDDDDLEGEAYLALVDAAARHEPGYSEESFAVFATKLIRSHLRGALEHARAVRLSRADERRANRGEIEPPRPYRVAVEDLGMAAPAPDEDGAALARLVESALDKCGQSGRDVIQLVMLDGLSIRQAAERLGITRTRARVEHDAACLVIAGEIRGRGWDEASWAQAIA